MGSRVRDRHPRSAPRVHSDSLASRCQAAPVPPARVAAASPERARRGPPGSRALSGRQPGPGTRREAPRCRPGRALGGRTESRGGRAGAAMAVEEGRALAARVAFGTAFWAREVRLPGGGRPSSPGWGPHAKQRNTHGAPGSRTQHGAGWGRGKRLEGVRGGAWKGGAGGGGGGTLDPGGARLPLGNRPLPSRPRAAADPPRRRPRPEALLAAIQPQISPRNLPLASEYGPVRRALRLAPCFSCVRHSYPGPRRSPRWPGSDPCTCQHSAAPRSAKRTTGRCRGGPDPASGLRGRLGTWSLGSCPSSRAMWVPFVVRGARARPGPFWRLGGVEGSWAKSASWSHSRRFEHPIDLSG